MKNELQYNSAMKIVGRLTSAGYKAFFAGGYVRDMALRLEQKGDIDIATDAAPREVASLFERVKGVGEHFGVMLVIEDGIPFEVATFRSDGETEDGRHPKSVTFSGPKMDAMRRDFTINGMFLDTETGTIIDYVNGLNDISLRIIRTIGNPEDRFKEDYLRLLRAVRFSARFDFGIEDATWKAMTAHACGIRCIAQERIFQELTKMLTGNHPETAINLLSGCGLLAEVLPEIESLKGVKQPEEFHPEGDVYVHTLKALSFLENPALTTAWATLLHDTGKPASMQVTDRIRFNNHHIVGAVISRRVLERLRAPGALIESVSNCVERHMDFMNVRNMRLSTLKRFMSGPDFGDELEIHRADCMASHGDISNYVFLKEKLAEFSVERVKPPPVLTGKQLIELGLKPGPVFGKILKEAYDLQLEDKMQTVEDAEKWVIENRERLISLQADSA